MKFIFEYGNIKLKFNSEKERAVCSQRIHVRYDPERAGGCGRTGKLSTREADKLVHGVDYYWLSRMWADRGMTPPEADIIVCPKNAKEVSSVLKIANYYKMPVTTWGGGGGTQGGALPVGRRHCPGYQADERDHRVQYRFYVYGVGDRRHPHPSGMVCQ